MCCCHCRLHASVFLCAVRVPVHAASSIHTYKLNNTVMLDDGLTANQRIALLAKKWREERNVRVSCSHTHTHTHTNTHTHTHTELRSPSPAGLARTQVLQLCTQVQTWKHTGCVGFVCLCRCVLAWLFVVLDSLTGLLDLGQPHTAIPGPIRADTEQGRQQAAEARADTGHCCR